MATSTFEEVKKRIWSFWDGLMNRMDEDTGGSGLNKERAVVFIVALILALCLWLLVNLSRDFTLNVNLPVTQGNIPEDKALAEELPDFITVSVQGEGWKLISVYNNPPTIYVDVRSGEVDLYDQVQQQMNALPDINVQKVQPLNLNVELEDKITKLVPVIPHVEVRFSGQFGFVGEPSVQPDSIMVEGAASIVNDIGEWHTDSVVVRKVSADLETELPLREPQRPQLSLATGQVVYRARVSEYTEGEARVAVRTRDLPPGRNITFSPSSILVRYVVPIEEYTQMQDSNPFEVYVPYSDIREDSTGFISPRIELPSDNRFHIRLQSHQPDKVAYFLVIDN